MNVGVPVDCSQRILLSDRWICYSLIDAKYSTEAGEHRHLGENEITAWLLYSGQTILEALIKIGELKNTRYYLYIGDSHFQK